MDLRDQDWLWGAGTLGIAYKGAAMSTAPVFFPLVYDNDDHLRKIREVTAVHVRTGLLASVNSMPERKEVIAGYDAAYPNRLFFWVEPPMPDLGLGFRLTMPASENSFLRYDNIDDICNALRRGLKKLNPATSRKFSVVSSLT